jgi:hypothetical protein
VDAGPAIELMPPAQPTSPSIATGSGTVKIGLPTSAAVPSVSITMTADVVNGVSPSLLPPLSLLAPAIALVAPAAIGDGHAYLWCSLHHVSPP